MTPTQFSFEVQARASNEFFPPHKPQERDIMHAAMGMSTEAGEFLDAVKKTTFYGKAFDLVNAREELGDMLWYVSLAATALHISMEELMALNTKKLTARYGDAFSTAAANSRNLEKERQVLEGKDEPAPQYHPI